MSLGPAANVSRHDMAGLVLRYAGVPARLSLRAVQLPMEIFRCTEQEASDEASYNHWRSKLTHNVAATRGEQVLNHGSSRQATRGSC